MTTFELLKENTYNSDKLANCINNSTLHWHYSAACDRVWWAEDGNEVKTRAIFCRDRADVGSMAFSEADLKPCPLVCFDCPLRKYGVTIDAISFHHPYSPKIVKMIRRECQRNGFLPDIVPERQIRLRPKKSF